MKNVPYSCAMDSLMYAQVCIRSNIAYTISVLGRYMSNSDIEHWKAAKKVIRYLQKIKDFMLTYRRTDYLDMIGYYDSNFAGCVDDMKSTSEYHF